MNNSYLHIQLTKANWINPDQKINVDLEENYIWRIKISDFFSELKNFELLLTATEAKKFSKYKSETDQKTKILSRGILKILLGRYLLSDPQKIILELDLQKKPILKNACQKNIHFNVSHSGDWILIALSKNPIGVDLEQMNASFTYQNLLDFSFSKDEKNYIQKSTIPYQDFYKLWTRKEALLKATGKGLIDDLALIPSLDGLHQNPDQLTNSTENWNVTSFNVDENHISSTAFMPIKTALQFFNFQL